MNIVEHKSCQSFAVWVTGLPASGKSTVVASLKSQLAARGVDVAILESDALRPVLTPNPQYDEAERELFYWQMTFIGTLLTEHGVPVIFDATANRRAYRNEARKRIPRFLEIYLDSPLETCIARDPKGIYRQALQGAARTVPGVQTEYEPPETPDLVIHGDREPPDTAACRVIAKLAERGYLAG